MKKETAIFWFRRDLRLTDNCGLFHALSENEEVIPVFFFDRNILDKLEDEDDARVTFIRNQVSKIKDQIQKCGSDIIVDYGNPEDLLIKLVDDFAVNSVYTNRDYEPYANERDHKIGGLLSKKGIAFKTFKDQVVFEKEEITKDDGKPYTVFTPYSKKWKSLFNENDVIVFPSEKHLSSFKKDLNPNEIPSFKEMGFLKSNLEFPMSELDSEIVSRYHANRDYPSISGTTKLSVHLRFGTVSIRNLAKQAMGLNDIWLNELIWREFYQMILWHFPHVVGNSFKPAYDQIPWRNNQYEFNAWCEGKTGYPIVDAGMRELKATGFMHNRVRMITASFLTKHLLIDWRWGEAWFARYLLDFELASNNGGWQWAASSGCDAAPYFRVFNPYLQTEKFDPDAKYIKKWVPEFNTSKYPKAIVEHSFARKRVLETYKSALN